ncbi:MAG: Ubiquitin carboxyl-terminal hydrolase 24 [Trebouxia sp. A1-2]|nr:MAG: Ubiquitin carboxyl-terminal hydrolase 24 [Trebouxia sp. A1-2]
MLTVSPLPVLLVSPLMKGTRGDPVLPLAEALRERGAPPPIRHGNAAQPPATTPKTLTGLHIRHATRSEKQQSNHPFLCLFAHPCIQDQHQQQQFWNPEPGYEAMYAEAYQAYPSAAGQGWFGGQAYGDPGMYEHPGYGYDGQSDYRHPPQQQPRGRGHRPRQSNISSNAYYHGQPYVGQQIPSHLQHQQLPSQQHMSHQPPEGQQHGSQQASRQSSQRMLPQSSPPMVAQSHPQTQDLPRQAPQNHPSYPTGPPARQTSLPSSAHPHAAPAQPQSYPLPDPYADPHSAAATPELAAMYAQQHYPSLQTPFDGQQPAGLPNQNDPGGGQGLSSSGAVPTSPALGASEGPAARAEPTATPSPTEGSSSEQPPAPAPKAASSWASMVKAATSSPQPARRPSSAQASRPQHAQQSAQAHTQPSGGAQRAQQPAQRQGSLETGPQPLEQAASGSANGDNAAQPAARTVAGVDGSASAHAIQAASIAVRSGLKAPSSLAVGAAVPSTKDSILAQSGSSQQPDSSPSSTPPAAATAAASKSSKTTAINQPSESEVPKRSLKGFDEAVAQSVTALCQVKGAQEGSDQGIRLQPRGLKNSGNLCFMNSTLQALMAGSSFCAFMDGLRAAAPALPFSEVPNLYNFSQLARCFPVQPQTRALLDQPHPQAQDRAVSEQPHAKTDAEQPQAQDDSAAQPSVNGHEADEEERSESKADSEVMSVDGRAESVKSDAKPESKAELSAASKGDAKAATKGSRAPSRGSLSDAGVDPKAGKAVPKVASRSHLELAGPAVVPDMMYATLDIFNPHNAKLLAATAAGQELTMAQRLNRGVQKVAKQREQEDAQEFLTFLLDSTHQELLKLRAMYGTEGSAANTSYDENWEHVARKGKSNVTRGEEDVQGGRTLTSQIFGGAVQSTVKAARAKASVTVQPFNLLHLDIQSVNNVPAALQMLTKPEDIHDYKATDDSAPVNAKKEIKLLRLPRILVLHMCRFTYGNQGLTKLHKQMQFSLKLRVQQSLLADDCEQRRHGGADYELIASVSHHGKTPASGHYTADVKQPDGEWLRFDDDFVSHVNVPQVLSRDCEMYLLFYEMKPRT